jgi:hypothetical protein
LLLLANQVDRLQGWPASLSSLNTWFGGWLAEFWAP